MQKYILKIVRRIRSVFGVTPEAPQEDLFRVKFTPQSVERLNRIGKRCGEKPPEDVIRMAIMAFEDITENLEQGNIFQMIDRIGNVYALDFGNFYHEKDNLSPGPHRPKLHVIQGGGGTRENT